MDRQNWKEEGMTINKHLNTFETEDEYQARVKASQELERKYAYPARKVLRRGTTKADLAAERKNTAARLRREWHNPKS
jgi:predicted P-loop ATPase